MSKNSFKIKESIVLKPKSAPLSPEKGEIYFDQTENKFKIYEGGSWKTLIVEFEKALIYENNTAVIADGQPGVEDSQFRDGWYYQNLASEQKINWYFFDGINQANIQKQNFSVFAVVTFDSVASLPILSVYTVPTGTNDIMPGFAHSRYIYSTFSSTPIVGKKCLIYAGENPAIFPELPRIQVTLTSSQGERLPTERVLTASFGTNSAAAVGNVKLIAECLGITSPSYKGFAELRIRPASFVKLQTESSARTAADSSLDSKISAEIARATSAEASIALLAGGAEVSSEASARTAADASLQSQISVEVSTLTAADSSLNTRISAEASARIAVEASLDSKISSEVSTLTAADSSLDSKISSEEVARASADSSLDSKISIETSIRTAIDSSLASKISIETSIRTAIDSSLASKISSEVSTLTAADSSLASKISSEVSTLTAADSSLDSKISSEIARATSADSSLDSKISAEIARATSAEASIALIAGGAEVSSEIARATSAEASLDSKISTESSTRTAADSSLDSKISAEIARATSAEASIALIAGGTVQKIEVQAGSATSPSLTFSSDTNTGIFSPAADTIGITTAGVERMRVASNGQQSSVIPGGSTLYPEYKCRAWVSFNGTGSNSTNQTIRGSGNVTSVFKNATGDYTVNFTTAMPDANYVVQTSCSRTGGAFTTNIATNDNSGSDVAPTASAIRVTSNGGWGIGGRDTSYYSVAIFR